MSHTHELMSRITLKFRNADIERQFAQTQIKGSLGLLALCLLFLLLESAMYNIMRLLLFGFKPTTVVGWSLWLLKAFILVAVFTAYISKRSRHLIQNSRFWASIVGSIGSSLGMHAIAIFFLGTFFLMTLLGFLNRSEVEYLIIQHCVGILSASIFIRLSSLYINITTTVYVIVFVVLGFTATSEALRTYMVHVLPIGLMMFLAVVVTNYRLEYGLRLNFNYRLALTDRLQKAASLRQDSDRLLLNILPQPVVQK